MVVYEGQGAARGLDARTVWTLGEISHTIMRTLLEEKEPMIMMDAIEDPRFQNQTSAILSALRSIMFIPLRNAAGHVSGFLYADNRTQAGAFDNDHLEQTKNFVHNELAPMLVELNAGQRSSDLSFEELTGSTNWL